MTTGVYKLPYKGDAHELCKYVLDNLPKDWTEQINQVTYNEEKEFSQTYWASFNLPQKYKDIFDHENFVCASDAFFPFTDNIEKLLKLNCKAIIQPGGSKNDNKVIEYAIKKKIYIFYCQQK